MTRAEAKGSCPQCGGPVELDIGDPLLSCGFCRTRLYMIPPGGVFSYFLSPAKPVQQEQKMCFLPYWRFRGFKFRVHEEKPSDCSLVDVTIPAADEFKDLPLLGLAPQLGTVRLNPKRPAGMNMLNSPEVAIKRADAMIEALHRDRPVLEGIMGENSSIILAPFEIMKEYGDGVSIRPLWGPEEIFHLDRRQTAVLKKFTNPTERNGHMRFLPLICPECGADLPAFPRARAMLCRFCNRIWGLGSSSIFPKRFAIVADSIHRNTVFLPFWHFSLRMKGLDIDNRHGFFKRLFPYRHVPEAWKKEPVQIVIPAFKINPRLFFRLSTRMSSTRTDFISNRPEVSRQIPEVHVVNFGLEEAARSIRIVLLDLFRHRKRMRTRLLKSPLRVKASQLLLLPFRKERREYIGIHSGQAIPVAALELGVRL